MNIEAAHLGVDDERFGVVVSLAELIALRSYAGDAPAARSAASAAPPGSHASPRRTRGMEFAEVRPYQSGDDARMVDWRQTARRGRLYTKLFQEEHERPLRLLVDLGPGMRFGTRGAFKSVVAARVAALLAWAAAAAGDRIGGLVWNGETQRELPPLGRRHGVLQLLKHLAEASAAPPSPVSASLAAPLERLLRTPRPGSRVVLISDFAALDAAGERLLAALAGSAEVSLVHVHDKFEAEPPPGRYRLSDGERSLTLDLRSAAARADYAAAFAARRAALQALARRHAVSWLSLATDADPRSVLAHVRPQPIWRRSAAA